VGGAVQVELASGGAADLGDGVRHRRLHPHAEHVELEQAEVLDVVLVGLDHRVGAVRGGLDRQPVQQGGVGKDHAARVHGVAVRQRVQPGRQLPQGPEPLRLRSELPQLGQLDQGVRDIPGAQMREGFGDSVHRLRRDPERKPGVAQGLPSPVGLGHAGDRDPFPPEPLEDPVVDLQPTRRLHVEVDVWQRGPPLGQEPLFTARRSDRMGSELYKCVARSSATWRARCRGPPRSRSRGDRGLR